MTGFLEVARAIRQIAGPARPRAAPAPAAPPDAAFEHATASSPRSSNLRVRTEFTDRDRHAFLTESFEYIARYYENYARRAPCEKRSGGDRFPTHRRQPVRGKSVCQR